MRLISHRGNIHGPDPDRENHPDYVQAALDAGYDVEVDVWFLQDRWFFGHDRPEWEVEPAFLDDKRLWLHCKNLAAFTFLSECGANHHYFWHETDQYTLTSKHYIWTYPGCDLPRTRGIVVLPELTEDAFVEEAAGICSDWIDLYDYLKEE